MRNPITNSGPYIWSFRPTPDARRLVTARMKQRKGVPRSVIISGAIVASLSRKPARV